MSKIIFFNTRKKFFFNFVKKRIDARPIIKIEATKCKKKNIGSYQSCLPFPTTNVARIETLTFSWA